MDETHLDDFGRPGARVWQLQQPGALPVELGRTDVTWGKDSRIVGSVKSWSIGGVQDLGQLRLAAYDGQNSLCSFSERSGRSPWR